MVTFISFILVLVGAVNWLSIGALQYDFVAGLFGSQASMFSRIIYFFIGVGAIWLIVQLFRGKGKIKINDDGFEKNKKRDILAEEKKPATQNVEAGQEFIARKNYEHRINAEAGLSYADPRRDYRQKPPQYIDIDFNEPRPDSYERREYLDYPESKEIKRKDYYDSDF